MSITLKTLLPPALLDNPKLVAIELPRALMTRANFIPGVRHRLGWRGVRDCAKGGGGLTVRVTGMPGVYGVETLAADGQRDAGRATFGISYFPMPDEDLIESFSIDAGLAAQAGDYLERVREFTLHPDLRVLFHIAGLETFFTADPQGVGMALSAPEHDVVIAADGLEIQTPSGPVQAVPPGGTDQNFPAWDTALPLFNALAASASFCLGDSPDSLARHSMASTRRTYGMNAQIASETSPNSRTWLSRAGLEHPCSGRPELHRHETTSGNTPAPMPEDFADALWAESEHPGRRQQYRQTDNGYLGQAAPYCPDRLPRVRQDHVPGPFSLKNRRLRTALWPSFRTKSAKKGWTAN